MQSKINILHSRFRYDFFVIWGHGLAYLEQILEILRKEEYLEILRIEKHKIDNLKQFVWNIYKCDSVPLNHLKSKLFYLHKQIPIVVFVFVKNLRPQEEYFGKEEFRHIQCRYIKRIKEKIRENFNPKKNGLRTEDHVIHASDYEEQVDYALKLLGYRKGISFLDDSSELPFKKPYHISCPRVYTFKLLKISQLRARILVNESNKILTKELPIEQTPHFLSLTGGQDIYDNYYNQFKYTFLTDDHYYKKFVAFNQLDYDAQKNFDPILVTKSNNGQKYIILDGVHRTSIFHNKGISCINCVDLEFSHDTN